MRTICLILSILFSLSVFCSEVQTSWTKPGYEFVVKADIDIPQLPEWEWTNVELFRLPMTFSSFHLLGFTSSEECKRWRYASYHKRAERRAEKLCRFVGGYEAVHWQVEIATAGEVLVEAERHEMDQVYFSTTRCRPLSGYGYSTIKSPMRFKVIVCHK